jgi:cytidine deaminase
MSQVDDEINIDAAPSADSLPFSKNPELIFGLVGPIGVDLELVTVALSEALEDVKYDARVFRITELMEEIPTGLQLGASGYIESFRQRINYANKVREVLTRPDALAILAVSAIRAFRAEAGGNEEEPLSSQAYILRQFKRPEEVKLLRSIYGRQFIQISVHAPQEYRIKRIAKKESRSRRGLPSKVETENDARVLVKQDEKENAEGFGQNVRDAFPLADVVIDSVDKKACKETLTRFVRALFGDNTASPTHDEYGMYLAKSASLRSSALTRQVGAAIFRESGEIISLGSNEVPKSGGGTYWTGDKPDARDFVEGADPNDQKKEELLADLAKRLLDAKLLSAELSTDDPMHIVERMLRDKGPGSVRDSKAMDLLEFGRDIHAEMSAISDAARKGVSTQGATLYCTTFPCHICAKHIVAAGIRRLVYLEPYPKSYAEELHADAIEIDGDGTNGKVGFQRFIGISPYRYRDLFEKGKRKYSSGSAQAWNKDEMGPMLEILYPSYFKAEAFVVQLLKGKLAKLTTVERPVVQPMAKASNDP